MDMYAQWMDMYPQYTYPMYTQFTFPSILSVYDIH